MRLLAIILIGLIIAAEATAADISADSIETEIGDEICLKLNIKGLQQDDRAIEGVALLSEPSLFIIDSIKGAGPDWQLLRKNDSVYTFSGRLEGTGTSGEIGLCGRISAGSGTICDVYYNNLAIGGMAQNPVKGRIYVAAEPHGRPYVRFVEIERNYPNPVYRGQTTRWPFRLDIESDIEVKIYDLYGQLVLNERIEGARGAVEYKYTPDSEVSAGVYLIRFKTQTGIIYKNFIIEK
jgi:hypothetical protein